jgi:hypothetical protein
MFTWWLIQQPGKIWILSAILIRIWCFLFCDVNHSNIPFAKKCWNHLSPMLHVTCCMDYLPPFANIHPKSDPNVGKYSIRETHGLCITITTPNHELVRLTNGFNLSTLRLQTSLASRRRSMTKHATGLWALGGATGGVDQQGKTCW